MTLQSDAINNIFGRQIDRTSYSPNPFLKAKQAELGVKHWVDVPALENELKKARLKGEVRFDDGSRALYSTDGSNYRQVPIGVVIPKDEEDIIRTISICNKYNAPIVSRGGGTSLAGQCCNIAVVLDMSKYYNAILELNPEQKYAWVQPGLVLDTLRNEAEKHHLTFGPDPSTHNHCTLGGMIGNNSCGVHALMAGKTVDNIEELDIITYDGVRMTVKETTEEELEQIISQGGRRGEIYKKLKEIRDKYSEDIKARYPKIPRRVSGYNLDELLPENKFNVAKALVGSEGTCVVILRAKTRLVDSPPVRSLLVLGYADKYTAADHVPEILEFKPIGLEAIDEDLVDYMRQKHLHPEYLNLLPDGQGWLLVEFGGNTKEEADQHAHALMNKLKAKHNAPSMKLYDDKKEEKTVWKIRESGLGATARIPSLPDNWPGWEDSAVDPRILGEYLRKLQKLFEKYKYKVSLYGHFGQGCVHCRIPFNLSTAEGIQNYRNFMEDAADLVLSLGGSLSGEHGDGQARAELLPKMFGDKLITAFEEFKTAWDPQWKLNPGKIVRPNKMTDNLRIGTNYEPLNLETHFQFPDDQNNFARVSTRCVGVGECRRHEGGTMCPSYMVTREEMHSTRGRSHLLFEMLEGNPLSGGWQNEHVKEALDLCLACKGCRADCPVNVDMATYKAEFLAHYYEKRLRPRHAYAFGLINWWARIASHVPNITNFFTQSPGLSTLAKLAADVSPQRNIPQFASQTFKAWTKKTRLNYAKNPDVILFADTFNNYFHPTTAKAARLILEKAGYRVYTPMEPLCCGRPLYDFGMLPKAKAWLQNILHTLKQYIEDGIPIIMLEPSCMAVFKDELINFFPQDPNAQRLNNQTYLLSEFIAKYPDRFNLPQINAKALIQIHCHQKSVKGETPEQEILKKLGIEYETPEPGCCGMAGAFGFENNHADISKQIGNRHLIPAVEKASKSTLIITDGFSCKQQIRQMTDRQGLHLAEIIQLAYRNKPMAQYPEKYVLDRQLKALTSVERLLIILMLTVIFIVLFFYLSP